jgi:23S rRNA (pseudouridine1915-N3)-methyltransferase
VKVFLYYIGKAKDTHANALAAEYMRRADHYADCRMTEIRPGRNEDSA